MTIPFAPDRFLSLRWLRFVLPVVTGLPVAAQAPDDDRDYYELSPFIVTSADQRGYLAQTAVSATLLNTPLRDIPLSLRVVTEDFMNDTFAKDFAAAVQYVPGVTPDGETREEGSFNIRGFRVTRAKRDRLTSLYGQDMTNVARVEVVKGPNSILYGETSPGGVINYVTKRPLPERFQRIDVSVGSYGYLRGQIETTGPLWTGESGAMVLYRIDASYQESDGWRAYKDEARKVIAPMIEWRPFANTTLSLQYEWIDKDGRQVDGHHIYSTEAREEWLASDEALKTATAFSFFNFRDMPYDAIRDFGYKFTSASSNNYNRYKGKNLVLELQQHLWDRRVSIRANYTRVRPELDILTQQMNLLLFKSAEGQNVFTARTLFNNEVDSYQLQTSIRWEIGPVENRTLLGAEYIESVFRGQTFRGLTPPFHLFVPNLDTFPPQYLPNQPITQNDPTPISDRPDSVDARDYTARAVYASNLTTMFGGKLKFLLGGRYDYQQQYLVLSGEKSPRDTEFTPQGGIIYAPRDDLNFYASYSRSFVPRRELGNLFNPENPRVPIQFPLDPLIGTGREIGVKMDFFDARISGTIALFEITYDNFVRTERISYFDERGIERFFNETRQDVTAKSEGIEFDFIFTPRPNWQIVTGYAYIETTNGIGSDSVFKDTKGVPRHQFSVWSKYTLDSGPLEGFSIGTGARYTGTVRMFDPDPIRISDDLRAPSHWIFDVMLGYSIERDPLTWNFQLNVKNVFDRKHYFPNVVPGDPRQAFLSVGVAF